MRGDQPRQLRQRQGAVDGVTGNGPTPSPTPGSAPSRPRPLPNRPPRAIPRTGRDLPARLTSFVGRERELAEVRRLLTRTRLVTLTGAGGVGKTRLAVEIGSGLRRRFPDGVWVVDLAALADPALVAGAVASALGLLEQPGRPVVDVLTDFLRPRRALLVLDNAEHLLDRCAVLAEHLLRVCLLLRILATSRQPLGLPGEPVYQVLPLALPDPDLVAQVTDELSPIGELARGEAVALFLDRAAAALPTFRLTHRNAPAVAQICQCLDGIPLAIELAAARVRVLPVEHLAAGLGERLWSLASGSRTALPRHQTLRALIDWSYDLLPDHERALLRRLSVFAGGFTLEAAGGVCPGAIPDQLIHLVDKSLVVREERDGQDRYRLLQTIRQYASEKLSQAGDEATARDRHAAVYAALAQRAESHLFGPEQAAWLDRLEVEHANVRAGLDWLTHRLEQGEADAASALVFGAALGWFWAIRGYFREGRDRLTALLSVAGPTVQTPGRVDALFHVAQHSLLLGELDHVQTVIDEALALGRELRCARGTALALVASGVLMHITGDLARAAAELDEAVVVARQADQRSAAYVALSFRADVARAAGDLALATALLAECIGLAREQGDRWWTAHMVASLAHVTLLEGDHERALALAQESLRLRRDIRDRQGIAWSLEAVAWTVGAGDQAEQATRLLGAAEATRARIGAILVPQERAAHERTVAVTRAKLGDERSGAAYAAGRALPVDRAINEALGTADPPARPTPTVRSRATRSTSHDLTAREREVAALIAQGLTNRQIAEHLVITEGTVANYVQRVLERLGFRSRAQIAAWAVRNTLHAPPTG